MRNTKTVLFETNLPLPLFHRGKVRDTYELGDKLLIVATDRISAFDFVLPCAIPDKGPVLNQLSAFWFEKTARLVPNHFIRVVEDTRDVYPFILPNVCPEYLLGRSMIVQRAKRLPVECVVRGYLSGSAWAEYRENGTVSLTPMPHGLKESQELPEPFFTPTTKAEKGHDKPLTKKELKELVGEVLAEELERRSLTLYNYAKNYAQNRGIIIADTKFEFGLINNKLILIDELLTPDSSRFWDASQYTVGGPQPSFDKQPVRDWLIASGWNKEPPVPELPPDIIEQTSIRYRDAYQRLTGKRLRIKSIL